MGDKRGFFRAIRERLHDADHGSGQRAKVAQSLLGDTEQFCYVPIAANTASKRLVAEKIAFFRVSST